MVEMTVEIGCAFVGLTEELGDDFEVDTFHHKMRGEGVAEGMKVEVRGEIALAEEVFGAVGSPGAGEGEDGVEAVEGFKEGAGGIADRDLIGAAGFILEEDGVSGKVNMGPAKGEGGHTAAAGEETEFQKDTEQTGFGGEGEEVVDFVRI